MRNFITDKIRRCLLCQLEKFKRGAPKHPMIITDTIPETFFKCSMDICGPFKTTEKGNNYVLTMQDLFSKYMIMVPIKDQTAQTVAEEFIKKLVCVFGCPHQLLTDLGTNFMGVVIQQLAKKFKIKRCHTTAFRPQSNGSIERAHTTLNEFLRMYSNKDFEWDNFVEYAAFCYNTSCHNSTGKTPFVMVFGEEARLPNVILNEKELTYCKYIEDLMVHLNKVHDFAYEHLIKSKETNKFYYDKKLKPNKLKIGDSVFLECGSNRKKQDDCYKGPYKVLDILENHNVKIKIKKKVKIVHRDKLRLSYIDAC